MDELENKEIKHGRSRVWLPIVLVLVGGTLLLQELRIPLPDWLLTWQMLLIVIGIFMGFSNGFRGGGWVILILVGGVFLLDEMIPGFSFHRFIWPVIIIAIGILMLIRPRRPHQWQDWENKWKRKAYWKQSRHWNQKFNPVSPAGTPENYSSEEYLDSTSVFGGVKRVILTKNFRGGDITCFMGGCEIDLSQADIQGKVAIDVTQVFGGTKLTVPSNWQIHTEMTAFFGSIEDKRKQPVETISDKILIIEGTSIFGGIEIRNY